MPPSVLRLILSARRLHRVPTFRFIRMSSGEGSLSKFLAQNRTKYLDALKHGRSRDWNVAVGNEAGDLDSAASSIAYSYLASTLHGQPTVALLQTPRLDLQLRAENLYAYEIAGLHPSTDLLCIDDIPSESWSSFALVDHNRLASRFSESSDPPKVVAIIDHHDDEGAHMEADPRIITWPVGSCSSLVTRYFSDAWGKAERPPPRELASLILCAIFIDTNGLKPGGKAVPIDREAAGFLFPNSTFASSSFSSTNIDPKSIRDQGAVSRLIQTLNERKETVSHLSSRDLLRRDYKEYTIEPSSSPTRRTTVGLATVPLSPRIWLNNDPSPKFWDSMDAWMDERRLHVLGVLCTYNSSKGKHKRQDIWIVKRGHDDLKNALWAGLEAREELLFKRKGMGKKMLSEGMERDQDGDVRTPKGGIARAWKQGNDKATRKVIAPLVKEIIENS